MIIILILMALPHSALNPNIDIKAWKGNLEKKIASLLAWAIGLHSHALVSGHKHWVCAARQVDRQMGHPIKEAYYRPATATDIRWNKKSPNIRFIIY